MQINARTVRRAVVGACGPVALAATMPGLASPALASVDPPSGEYTYPINAGCSLTVDPPLHNGAVLTNVATYYCPSAEVIEIGMQMQKWVNNTWTNVGAFNDTGQDHVGAGDGAVYFDAVTNFSCSPGASSKWRDADAATVSGVTGGGVSSVLTINC